MKTIKITISGTTPLLTNKFTDASQLRSESGVSSAITTGDRGTPREQAERSIYYDIDGTTIGIPQPNLLRCIIDAGKFHKAGKMKVTTAKSSLITSCIDIAGAMIPLQFTEPWDVDTRAVRIPATGGRVLKHRARFSGWLLSFEITLDETMMSEKTLRAIVDDAGRKIGLGDFRPDCKGPFGKFVVNSWVSSNGNE